MQPDSDFVSEPSQPLIHLANGLNRVLQMTSDAATATVDAGKQVYGQARKSPITEKLIQHTESAVSSASKVASEAIDIGKHTVQTIADSEITGPTVRFTGATLGSASTLSLWAKALASRSARAALRASCINNAIRMYSWSQLPAPLRAVAVRSGVLANNYIVSGVVPGLFTIWAIYDGYRLVRLTYKLYQDNELVQDSELVQEYELTKDNELVQNDKVLSKL